MINVLSKCDHIDGNIQISVLGVLDDISLMFIDGNVKNTARELNILRVGFSKLLCRKKIIEEAEKEDKPKDTINDKEISSQDKIKSVQDKKWF